MSKRIKFEGIIIIFLGVFVAILSFKLGGFSLKKANQSLGLFPLIISLILIGCGIKLILETKIEGTKTIEWPTRSQAIRVLCVFLTLMGYVPAVKIFGYLAGTVLIFGIQCWLLGANRFWRIFICAVLLSFLCFYLFQKVLYIDLPDGIIPKILGVVL